MTGQTEIIGFLQSLKPFVNKQGIVALNTLENIFNLLSDPKVEELTSNVQSFTNLRKKDLRPNKEKEETETKLEPKSFRRRLRTLK